MKIFISWSGETSKNIASLFKKYIKLIIQASEPYYVPKDTPGGSRWEGEVAQHLQGSQMGIIILTPEALQSPWVAFEAGALAHNINQSNVVPILFDLQDINITGPLVAFQRVHFQKESLKQVFHQINNTFDTPLPEDTLNEAFEAYWIPFSEKVEKELKLLRKEVSTAKKRSDRNILEEVLERVRKLGLQSDEDTSQVEVMRLEELVNLMVKMSNTTKVINAYNAEMVLIELLKKGEKLLHPGHPLAKDVFMALRNLERRGGRSGENRFRSDLF